MCRSSFAGQRRGQALLRVSFDTGDKGSQTRDREETLHQEQDRQRLKVQQQPCRSPEPDEGAGDGVALSQVGRSN